MVTIVDYGIGNLRSIEKAFEAVDATPRRTDDPAAIAEAERLVVPGVGAFGACINEIRRRNLEQPLLDFAASGRPFLGVCVGMQLLFDKSKERGEHSGLGLLPGRVVRFDGEHPGGSPRKVPHMGWNTVDPKETSPLLREIKAKSYFYFVHSYRVSASSESDVLATSSYGHSFPAIVHRNNVFGVQFHPEKSQQNGLRILKNFVSLSHTSLTH